MKNKNSYRVFFALVLTFVFGICIFITGCTNPPVSANQVIVTGAIMFGKSRAQTAMMDTSGGTPCSGRGVCNLSIESCVGCIPISFYVKDTTPLMLVASFSFGVLSTNQPDQRQYFAPPSTTYQFEQDYALTNPIFQPLNLPPGSIIKTTDKTHVRVLNNQVTLMIEFSHDQTQQ